MPDPTAEDLGLVNDNSLIIALVKMRVHFSLFFYDVANNYRVL